MTKKPTTKKRTTTRRKRKTTNPQIQRLKIINYTLFALVIILSVGILFYYNNQDNKEALSKVETPKVTNKQEPPSRPHPIVIRTEPIKTEKTEEKIAKSNEKIEFEEYTKEFEKEYIPQKPKIKESIKKDISTKPKLAIVIDDVTFEYQVKSINNIGYKVNMAFLPPTKLHPNSAKIAQNIPFYLVHFPMEAMNFKHVEENTLYTTYTYEQIDNMVKKMREYYPTASFTNNHTGSKFTAHKESMDMFMQALRKYDFSFLDSRTTAKTVAQEYAQKHQIPFVSRNIFLDNSTKYSDILAQLKKALIIAKKEGYAVAIGHPHNNTIKVLKESKELLNEFDLVYLKDIPHEDYK